MRTLSDILTSKGATLIILRGYLHDWEHITKSRFNKTQLLGNTFCVVAKKTLELFTFMTLAAETKPRPTPTRSAFQIKLPLPVLLIQT
jgi:hypothetical protein